jgi:predicted DNA-binding protein with PD1-like motif
MRVKVLKEGPQRTFAVVLDEGEEVVEGLLRFAEDQQVTASGLTAIGAFRRAVLGYFDWEKRDYLHIPVDEQVEVVSVVGNLALGARGERRVHAHAVLANRSARAFGGHLLEGVVRPTFEALVVESPSYLRRRTDARTGLPLIDLSAT